MKICIDEAPLCFYQVYKDTAHLFAGKFSTRFFLFVSIEDFPSSYVQLRGFFTVIEYKFYLLLFRRADISDCLSHPHRIWPV